MNADLKTFQKRYILSNKEMAAICKCSLPTIQKWRSGDVNISGAASQLLTILDMDADGNPVKLREILSRMNYQVNPSPPVRDPEMEQLESSMNRVVDRLEGMLEERRRDRELAESEARYKSMLDSSDYPVCRWLPDTTLTYVNEAYARLFSSHGESLLGRKWMAFIPEERRSAYATILSDMTRRGEEEVTYDVVTDAEGNDRHLQWRDVPVLNARREVVEFHSFAHDITELVRLRQAANDVSASKDALLALSDQPVLIFDNKGAFHETNVAFRTQVLQSREWGELSDAISKKALGTLKRLLKRASLREEVCFRVMIQDTAYLMKVRRLSSDPNDVRHMAIFESLTKASENAVMQVRLRHEALVEGDRREFMANPQRSREIEQQMASLGHTVRADRIYVFTFDRKESVFNNVLEWCAEGITPHLDDLQGIPMSEYPWWIKRLDKHQWIIVEDTSKMPRGAARESEILKAQDIRSVMCAPLVRNEETAGFVGIDYNRSTRLWHDQEKKELVAFKCAVEAVLADIPEGGAAS